MLTGSYCVFIATAGEEKIAWSYGSVLYVHLNSLRVLDCRNLVSLSRKLKKRPFHGTISLLFMSPRNILNSPWSSPESREFGEEWVEVERAGSEALVLCPPGLMTCVCVYSDRHNMQSMSAYSVPFCV